MKYNRITINPDQMAGVPCVRGLRIPLSTIVGKVAEGMNFRQILDSFPNLENEDLAQSLQFAAEDVSEREFPHAKSVAL